MTGPKMKILHIDDDEHVLGAVRRALEYAGYVVASSTGPFIGHLIEKEHPDLLVVDVEMPFISGDKSVGILKSRPEYAELPVVFFSGMPSERVKHLLGPEGRIFFVAKDAGINHLVEVIGQALG